jgi:hypothetical protein
MIVLPGEMPVWSDFVWSETSQARYARIDEQFHERRTAGASAFRPSSDFGTAARLTSDQGKHIPYRDRMTWSRDKWSDIFVRNHGFGGTQGVALLAADPVYAPAPWGGPWLSRPWALTIGWERRLPPWTALPAQIWSKSQMTHADAASDGAYGDINACRGAPHVLLSDTVIRWSDFVWSETDSPRYARIDEQRHETLYLGASPVCGGGTIGVAITLTSTA